MKTALILILGSISILAASQDKGINIERLMSKDANKDGKLSKEELGDQFWQRSAGQDANGDSVLDQTEITAMQGKKGKRSEQARPGGANASFQVREFKGSNGQTLRYSLLVPAQKSDALPLVLCLHGSGGNTAAANVLAAPAMQAKHPCIIIAPACEGKSTRWVEGGFRTKDKEVRAVMPELMEMLDAVIAEFKADPTRIYVTGQSLGGVGSWGLIASHASKFAAAVPVCGIWEPAEAAKMNGVAIWAFHGADDPTVPVSGSRDMIAALKKAAVTPEPKYTEFPGVGHGSWEPTYATAELWEWLFAQRKTQP